jgi:hypothetical protein
LVLTPKNHRASKIVYHRFQSGLRRQTDRLQNTENQRFRTTDKTARRTVWFPRANWRIRFQSPGAFL